MTEYIHGFFLALIFLLLSAGPTAWAVEHPGSVEKDCLTCHMNKVTGKSVHSVMSSPCTVCHLMMTRGDMTTISLSMSKARICTACHDESAALRQHVPGVKGSCMECHDAHSSERRLLLLRDEAQLRPTAAKRK